MTKTHTIRVDHEQWEFCDGVAQAAAEPGERPNVSAVVRKAIREFMDRHHHRASKRPEAELSDPSSRRQSP